MGRGHFIFLCSLTVIFSGIALADVGDAAIANAEISATCGTVLAAWSRFVSPSFVPIQHALDLGQRALRLANAAMDLPGQRRPEINTPEWQHQFLILYRKALDEILARPTPTGGKGGLIIYDTVDPSLPFPLASRMNVDHHGRNFDPNRPEHNTTMMTLDKLEELFTRLGSSEAVIAQINRDAEWVSTDNLGDGLWSVWIRDNLRRVLDPVHGPKLRELIRKATYYEDFGVFGSTYEQTADAQTQTAIELQQAVLAGYDLLIRKYRIYFHDRFHSYSDTTSSPPVERARAFEEQKQIVGEAKAILDAALGDVPTMTNAFRATMSRNFKTLRALAAKQIAASHERAKSDAYNELVSAHGFSRGQASDLLQNLSRFANFYYDVDPVLYGRFASWAAPAIADPVRPISIGFSLNVKTGRSVIVISVLNGRTFPAGLENVGAELQRIHMANVRAQAQAEFEESAAGKAMESLEREEHSLRAADEAAQKENVRFLGRERLQFAFGQGALVSPAVVLKTVAEMLGPNPEN